MKTTTEWVVQETDVGEGKHWEDVDWFANQQKAIRQASRLSERFRASWRHRVVIRVEVVVWEDAKSPPS